MPRQVGSPGEVAFRGFAGVGGGFEGAPRVGGGMQRRSLGVCQGPDHLKVQRAFVHVDPQRHADVEGRREKSG